MAEGFTLRPRMHVNYTIATMVRKNPSKVAVVWYNSETLHSAGMKWLTTLKKAIAWSREVPPQKVEGDDTFDRAIIVVPHDAPLSDKTQTQFIRDQDRVTVVDYKLPNEASVKWYDTVEDALEDGAFNAVDGEGAKVLVIPSRICR
jgi:hypothetical protein